jgi:hypothetical protein
VSKDFFVRLRTYYEQVGAVLRGEAGVASIFPNTTDIGMAREKIYSEFLRLHAPSKCNVFLGGFVFDMLGNESRQLDVIITTDTTPQFNFHNKDGGGKSFSPVEGTLGVVSIKSVLNKNELEDALLGIASIPLTTSLNGRTTAEIQCYEDWPYKVVYASDGISSNTISAHLTDFYSRHPDIPLYRRPHVIHVAGKYAILRTVGNMFDAEAQQTGNPSKMVPGGFNFNQVTPDLQGILWVINGLQENALASAHIFYDYGELINKINGINPE